MNNGELIEIGCAVKAPWICEDLEESCKVIVNYSLSADNVHTSKFKVNAPNVQLCRDILAHNNSIWSRPDCDREESFSECSSLRAISPRKQCIAPGFRVDLWQNLDVNCVQIRASQSRILVDAVRIRHTATSKRPMHSRSRAAGQLACSDGPCSWRVSKSCHSCPHNFQYRHGISWTTSWHLIWAKEKFRYRLKKIYTACVISLIARLRQTHMITSSFRFCRERSSSENPSEWVTRRKI